MHSVTTSVRRFSDNVWRPCLVAVVVLAAALMTAPVSAASPRSTAPVPRSHSAPLPQGLAVPMEPIHTDLIRATASGVRSCRHYRANGNYGWVSMQYPSPGGFLTWGMSNYDHADNYGLWWVSIWVRKPSQKRARQVDYKVQDYEPHGRISPKALAPGSFVHTVGLMKPANSENYRTIYGRCVVP